MEAEQIYIYISIIEALYVIYMMNYFKTNYSLHLPFEKITQYHKFLMHPINTGRYESKVCPFGNLSGFLIAIWIIIRILYRHNNIIPYINTVIWIIIVILSFIMNVNCFIYLIPAFLLEIGLYFFYFNKGSITTPNKKQNNLIL